MPNKDSGLTLAAPSPSALAVKFVLAPKAAASLKLFIALLTKLFASISLFDGFPEFFH